MSTFSREHPLFGLDVFVCPACSVPTRHELSKELGGSKSIDVGPSVDTKAKGDGRTYAGVIHAIWTCPTCSTQTYQLVRLPSFPGGARLDAEVLHQHPVATPSEHPGLPSTVRDALNEAIRCFNSDAPNACGTMLRRAVHALCAQQEASGANLYEQLANLRDQHKITKTLWDWAEELRTAGKVGAHPEWEAMTKEEARYALNLAYELVRYVYVNPWEVEQRKLKDSKRRST